MLLTSKTIVQIQSKLEAIKACCVILSKETLIASVRVMNHVHSVTFLHRYICDVHGHIDNLWRVLNVVYYMNIYNEDIKLIYKIPCLFSTPPSPPPIAICDVFITRLIMLEAAMKNNFQFFCDMWLKAIIVHKITFCIVL